MKLAGPSHGIPRGVDLIPHRDRQKRDLAKMICVFAALIGAGILFLLNPTLSTPTLASIVFSMMLSPFVAKLERHGHPRTRSILMIFGTLGLFSAALGAWALQSGEAQWDGFKEKAPLYFETTIQKLKFLEHRMQKRVPALEGMHPTESLVQWASNTSDWFVQNGPGLMGSLMTCLLLVPFLTFVLLKDGRAMRKSFLELVPNRYFEMVFMISHRISTALSDYLRAKLFEAFLVGALTSIGLAVVGCPYAIILGFIAGITNIIPYLGPVVGAIPGILIVLLEASHPHRVVPVVAVYIAVNLIDTLLIFPVVVAKLVDLHPLILISVVAIGQKYYGLLGMLVSIPIASAFKVVIQEVHQAIYGYGSREWVKKPIEPTMNGSLSIPSPSDSRSGSNFPPAQSA